MSGNGDGVLRWQNERYFGWYFRIPVPVRLALAVVMTCLLTAGMASTRGIALALLAALVYGSVFVVGGVSSDRTLARIRRHPWWERAILGPLVFLPLARYTHLPLLVCALVGLGVYALMVAAILMRRREVPLG